jgi:low molecular weight protein-tyrosine phosphatase
MFTEHVRREGLADRVRVTSTGIGSWQAGQGIDPRAAAVLTGHGIAHTVRKLDDHLDADVSEAAERLAFLRTAVTGPGRVRLLRHFDPAALRNAELADRYHGTAAGYENTLAVIERCVPALLGRLQERS